MPHYLLVGDNTNKGEKTIENKESATKIIKPVIKDYTQVINKRK